VIPSNVDERKVRESDPVEKAKKIARLKARAVAPKQEGVIIAADTFGVLGDIELQKPKNLADARRMLRLMSGKRVKMVTGVCVIDTRNGTESTSSRIAYVSCKKLSDDEIERYVKTRPVTKWAAASNPVDKASAAIFAPVGRYAYGMDRFSLPIDVVVRALARAGIQVNQTKLKKLSYR